MFSMQKTNATKTQKVRVDMFEPFIFPTHFNGEGGETI